MAKRSIGLCSAYMVEGVPMIFEQMFDMINAGIVILDKELRVYKWNRWMEAHSKISSEEILGMPLIERFSNLNKPWFLRNCKAVFTFGSFAFFSQKLHNYCLPFNTITSSGFEYMQQDCTMGPLRNEKNEIEYIYLMVQDVTEVADYERMLLEINIKDALTGVYNRLFLEQCLEKEFERHKRYSRPFSMIIMDIDHFKNVNDTYGHQCGDFILKVLTSLMTKKLRSIDIIARYGGEEFCMLLPETGLKPAVAVAERIRENVEKAEFNYNELKLNITISQGVSEIKDDILSAADLLKKADDALYQAKRTGRNKVVSMK